MSENKAIKAGIGYTVANYLIKGLTLFTLPLFTRLLTIRDFGIYNTFLAYENILTVILGVSFYSSFNAARFKFNKIEQYISTCITFSILFSICSFVLLQIFYPLYGDFVGMNRALIGLLVFYSFSTAIITYYNSYVGLEFQYKKFICISAIGAIGNILVSLFFVIEIFSNNRGVGRIVGMSIPTILLSCYILYFFYHNCRPQLNKEFINYALKYCLPVIPHSLSQIILNQFDRIMITLIIGEAESGVYSFAYTLFSILLITITSLDKVWGPWFFNKLNEQNYESIKNRSTQYAGLMVIMSIILLLTAPEIIKILGPKEYWEANHCVMPIVVAGYFSFLYYIPCQVEYYYGKTKYIAIGSVAAAFFNVILNLMFIKKFGYIAAAYTTLISYFLYFIFHYIISIKIARKCLFNTKAIVVLSTLVVIIAIVSRMMIDMAMIRWLIAIGVIIFLLIIMGRIFDFKEWLRKYKNR